MAMNPLIAYPGAAIASYTADNAIKKEYGENIAQFLWYGLPSLINQDWSYTYQLLNWPEGGTLKEKLGSAVLGPVGGTLISVIP